MAKPRTPNQKKRYAALNKRLAKYVTLVQNVYDSLSQDAAGIVLNLTDYRGDKPFRFKDYPQTKAKVDELMRFFSHDIRTIVYSGINEEWKNSNLVQDLLATDVLKAYGVKHGKEKYKVYYQPNNDAKEAFLKRKDKGQTFSQKLWNQSYNFKREMEYAISSAIEKGQSAVTLSKRISKYLRDFPSLCDDYKEMYGEAVDCKNCEYRSIRLARSEINMAYRTAEQTRWQQMDFIKGYEIKLSHAHPRRDMCDDLAGVYPKWFKWYGWHPNCMCYCIPIVMTDDEWYSGKGEEITELPPNYEVWVANNRERIHKAETKRTTPYFINDNYKYGRIDRGYKYDFGSEDNQFYIVSNNSKTPVVLTEAQKENLESVASILKTDIRGFDTIENIKKGVNPKFFEDVKGATYNCQCCVIAYEARMRGLPVEAAIVNIKEPESIPMKLAYSKNRHIAWIDAKTGDNPSLIHLGGPNNSVNDSIKELDDNTKTVGRYQLGFRKYAGNGHRLCVNRFEDGSYEIYCGQTQNTYTNWEDFIIKEDVWHVEGMDLLRIDDKLFNLEVIGGALVKSKL